MKPILITFLFLLLGLGFASLCIYLILLPPDIHNLWPRGHYDANQNTGVGSIATAILAVGCFIASSLTLKRNSTK